MNKKEWVCWLDGFFICLYFVAVPVALIFTNAILLVVWFSCAFVVKPIRDRVVMKKYTAALEEEGM